MLAVMPKVPYGELLVSLDFLRHTNFFLMNIMIQICIVSPLQSTLQSFIFLHYKKIYFTNNKRENNLKTAYHILHGLDLKNPPSQPFQKWERRIAGHCFPGERLRLPALQSDFTRRGTELAVSFLVRAKINLQNLSQMSQIWLANKSRGTHPVNIVFLIIFYTVSTIVLLDIRSLSDRRFK